MTQYHAIRVEHEGRQWSLRELALSHGVDPGVVRNRYTKGKRGEALLEPVEIRATTQVHRFRGLL